MAVPAIALHAERARPAPRGWIIGRTSDLTWLIGGALVAYGLLAAHLFLGVAAVTIYMIWVLAIDGPHVFATLSRTYLDRRERAARATLLRWSLCFFALGPASVGVSALAGQRFPYDLFLTFCMLWAYWHVVRQHYGVMVLYKKKASDMDAADDRVDSLFLYVGLLAPIVSFAVTHERTLAMLGIEAPTRETHMVSIGAWSLVGVALLALAARQLDRIRRDVPLNIPKLLFLAAAISVSVVLFSPPVAARIEYEAVFPIVTSFHNVQYLAIVWFFHQNRRAAPDRPHRIPHFSRSVWIFLGAGLAFTAAYRVLLGCAFSAWPGCNVGAQDVRLPAGLTLSDLGVAFLWGFALHHYYLDQKIWHVRRDAALSHDLRLDYRQAS